MEKYIIQIGLEVKRLEVGVLIDESIFIDKSIPASLLSHAAGILAKMAFRYDPEKRETILKQISNLLDSPEEIKRPSVLEQ